MLSRWGELESAPTATWVQHALVRRHGRHFPDYYILCSPLQHLPQAPTTPSTTPNPYTQPINTPDPYTPLSSSPDPYNPYTSPSSSPDPYNPYTTTPSPYDPYTTTPSPYDPYTTTPNPYTFYTDPVDRYVRSATYGNSRADLTVIFRLVMRGSAVAAANITCTRY